MQKILGKILAAAPDPLQLTDDELAKLSAYLKTHRRKVSLSAMQRAERGDLAERQRLDQDESRWAAWRCALAYNVELRKAAPVATGEDAEPDLSDVLQGMDDEHGLALPELARQLAALADDVEAASYVPDPLRHNAADLSQAARLQFRDTSMERREVEPGRWQWFKRDTRNRPLDERRLEHHLCQALAVLDDLRDGRKAGDTSTKLRAIAKGIEQTAPKPGDGESDVQANAKPAGMTGNGIPWQEAMKAGEAHSARNPFPGVKALAKIVGCSPSTMSKAIDRSAKLRARLSEHEAQRKSVSAGVMTEGAAASAKQSREPDPIDAAAASTDDLFRRLLEQAKPSERAKLNAMTPAQRRELIATIEHDPDKSQTVRGPKR